MRICHGEIMKSNGMNYDDSLARKVQISTMTWDSCPNPILTGSGVAPLTDVVIFTIVVEEKNTSGMGATDTDTLRFRNPV